MKKISETIIFFGNERLATGVSTEAPTLQSLIRTGYNVAAVVTNYEEARSRSSRKLEIADVARQHNIPILVPSKMADITDQLSAYNATIGVLVAFGKIVPQHIIDLFPHGIVNIHPSLLPLYRGPTPIESVILDGATKTGVSIMRLEARMDAGPVYAQARIALSGKETKQQLATSLLNLGSKLLIDHLPNILSGLVVPNKQNDTKATYCSLITKEDGIINWGKPAKELEREIRAYLEWPKSRTTLANKEVIITHANTVNKDQSEPGTVVINQGNQLLIQTGGGMLDVKRLKPAGKNEMSAAEFIRGYLINASNSGK